MTEFKEGKPCRRCGEVKRYASTGRCPKCSSSYVRTEGTPRSHRSNAGAACEHLVISELLRRNLPTGGPYNQNGKHDLFVRVTEGWKTVQVKMTRVTVATNKIISNFHRREVTSDLIAAVDLPGKRIRWISNTQDPVPLELLGDNNGL